MRADAFFLPSPHLRQFFTTSSHLPVNMIINRQVKPEYSFQRKRNKMNKILLGIAVVAVLAVAMLARDNSNTRIARILITIHKKKT
jgi:hypothetical protein